MNKNVKILILPLFAAFLIITIFIISNSICPDTNGYLIKYQANTFKSGNLSANFYDTENLENSPKKVFVNKIFSDNKKYPKKFYKISTLGFVLGSFNKILSTNLAWKIISIFSYLLSAFLLFLILKSFSPIFKISIFLPIFLLYPAVVFSFFKVSESVILMLFTSLLIYVYYLKTDYFLKWYLMSVITAFLCVDYHFAAVIFYAIPFAAFLKVKETQTTYKAFLRFIGLFIFGALLNIYVFIFYSDSFNILTNFNMENLLNSIKTPLTVMIIINFIGIFKSSRYVKKYIYPSFLFYIIFIVTSLTNGYSSMLELSFLPPIFLGFATCIIHQKIYRKCTKIITFLSLVLTAFLCVTCIKDSWVLNKSSNIVDYQDKKAIYEIDKTIPLESSVYLNCSLKDKRERNLFVLKSRKVIISKNIKDNNADFLISQDTDIDNYELLTSYTLSNMQFNILKKDNK